MTMVTALDELHDLGDHEKLHRLQGWGSTCNSLMYD